MRSYHHIRTPTAAEVPEFGAEVPAARMTYHLRCAPSPFSLEIA